MQSSRKVKTETICPYAKSVTDSKFEVQRVSEDRRGTVFETVNRA